MDSDPLLCRTKLVPFCHFGLSRYLVTVFIDSRVVAKFDMLDAIHLGILNFEILDFTVDLFFLTITVFEADCIKLIMQGSYLSFVWIRDRWVIRRL